jgi:hypothetical protein
MYEGALISEQRQNMNFELPEMFRERGKKLMGQHLAGK